MTRISSIVVCNNLLKIMKLSMLGNDLPTAICKLPWIFQTRKLLISWNRIPLFQKQSSMRSLSLPAGLTNTLVPYFLHLHDSGTVFLDNVNIPTTERTDSPQYQSYYSSRECRVFLPLLYDLKKISIYILIALIQHFNKQIAFVAISVFQPCNSFYFTIFEIYKMGALFKSKF